ncbi:MAG: hypothetical protein JJT89_06065 [Nitriliruptoraceae bacterium]|nr:hypothetical protein [Nitriliruptoraceae bacterium]
MSAARGTRSRPSARPLVALTVVLVLGCTPRPTGDASPDADERPAETVEILIEERIEVGDGP